MIAMYILFALAVLAAHDAGTATGTGFYMQLKTGALSREAWDVIVDAVLVILTLVCVCIPAIRFRSDMTSVSLFVMAGISLIPLVRPDRLVTVLMGDGTGSFEQALQGLLSNLPLMIITYALVYALQSEDAEHPRFIRVCGLVAAVLCTLSLTLAVLSDVFLFFAGYTILLPVLKGAVGNFKGRGLMAAVFFLGGMWKMISILFAYHM